MADVLSPIVHALRSAPAGPVHLLPFVPAGFGRLEATAAILKAVAEAGASVIEVGFPFSDPVADGPTIQAAYHEALEAGVTVDQILDALAASRQHVSCPMLTMVSYSIVRRRGDKAFCAQAKAAGLDGILCPDLPPPEADRFAATARDAGLAPVLLVAPTTPPARRDVIGKLADGFIYYLSVAGITGQRDELPPELAAGVKDMKQRTHLPVCVGFGISKHEHLLQLAGVADGAIVGSELVRAISAAKSTGTAAMAAACGKLTRNLLGQNG